jgi:hypothetical protein
MIRLRKAERNYRNIAGSFTSRPIQKFLAENKTPSSPQTLYARVSAADIILFKKLHISLKAYI